MNLRGLNVIIIKEINESKILVEYFEVRGYMWVNVNIMSL
jgi:hypothetical protein